MVSRYGPVKQEGICLLPPPQFHRMIQQQPHQRADGYQVSAQQGAYVQQQQNQGGNQGPALRGLAPTGPPNQSSTPPNTTNTTSLPQQPSMNHMFVQPGVRSTQQGYFPRSTAPSQPPRMPNQHNRPQQQMYPQAPPYMQLPQMYIATNPQMYYSQTQRAPQGFNVQPTLPMFTGQHVAYPYNHNPAQASTLPCNYYFSTSQMRTQAGPPPQATSAPPNPAQQTLPNIPMPTIPPQHPPYQRSSTNKRRPKALAIIDPSTGEDRLNEMYDDNSHPPSGESSARQTPQPSPHNTNKEVQAAFAKQVAQAISNDNEVHHTVEEPEHHDNSGNHIEQSVFIPTQVVPPPPPQNRDLEHIVQSSVLKVQAKEFVSSSITAKETPIVSANCDAVEVTLPNKQAKDRESPVKGRKQREQQAQPTVVAREHKDSIKESIKDSSDIKPQQQASIVKDDIKQKTEVVTVVSATTTNVPAVPLLIKDSKDSVVTQHQVRDDKRNNKKDNNKIESKVPSVETSESVAIVAPVTVQPIQNAQEVNAKTKQNAPTPKPAPQTNNQKPAATAAPAHVPPPQPAKANNKSHKKSELNLKGAKIEGTDMDAFNDNILLEDSVNANLVNANATNDIINANSVAITDGTTEDASVIDSNKKNDSNEAVTIKPEMKTLPKGKIDVCAIVREVPIKPFKAFVAPQSTDSHDETDRVALSNDKLVQAKNEANAKGNSVGGDAGVIDTNKTNSESKLPYKEGQWSPNNLDGKKVYQSDFLLALRNVPASKKKPDNSVIPESIFAHEGTPRFDGRGASMGGRTDFIPPFTNYGGKSSSQRGAPPKRNSQSGKPGGGNKGGKPTIKVSISVREDVKLHESENAWRPARLGGKGAVSTEDDKKTAELYKKVRGVLNKLTPQKFNTLVGQVRELEIDTTDRLQGVIDLVFEKAVDEPNFSVAYALMCKELALMQVPSASSTEDKQEFVNFRKLLITRCQVEFEKQSVDEVTRNEKIKVIETTTDAEKKKDLQFEIDEEDRRLRMKSVGNIRFIGELFKQQMLTVNIMLRCLNNLLTNKDEESLECLCKLLTTIGKELEHKGVDLNEIFGTMKDIVTNKHGKVSSRVRFMLQDVIDLRSSKWVPRRQDLNPKTIDQIQKEADHEQLNIQAMNSVPITPRKDDRGMSGNSTVDRKRGKPVVEDGGWVVTTRSSRGTPFSVQSDKLKNKLPQLDAPLGSPQLWSQWSKGSNVTSKNQPSSLPPNTGNMYSALENIGDTEKRSIGPRGSSKDPYSSKGPSMERTFNQQPFNDGRSSRSGSQQRSNDKSSMLPSSKPSTPAPVAALPKPVPQQPAPVLTKLTEEQLERRVKNCLEEYLTDSCTVEEYDQDVKSSVPSTYLSKLVADGYLHVLERSKSTRIKTGGLFAKLINMGSLPLDEYCKGLDEILIQAEDLVIDIPKFWEYLPEILLELVCREALPIKRLHTVCKSLIEQGHAHKFLSFLFKITVEEKGPNFLQNIWQISELSLTDFMPSEQVSSFVKDNKLEFLIGGECPVGQTQITYEQIQEKLGEFFRSKTSTDDINKWITVNVGQRVKEEKFIRALSTAIFQDSISKNKLVKETLSSHYTLLQKYVDNDAKYELQCLYAVQALIHQLEHPQGLLLSICDKLYEDTTFSQESFVTWESSTDPAEQEGKGVAIKQLTSFFTQLKENDDEEYDGSSSSEET